MINDERYYNDMTWGLCSFCTNITECETEFETFYPLVDYRTTIASANLQLVTEKAATIAADPASASSKDVALMNDVTAKLSAATTASTATASTQTTLNSRYATY
jgi:hypothetical protein